MFFKKKGALKNFAIFTGEHLSLFNKIAASKACNFIKKKLKHRCFLVLTAKFLRKLILKNTCERLLLNLQNGSNSPYEGYVMKDTTS